MHPPTDRASQAAVAVLRAPNSKGMNQPRDPKPGTTGSVAAAEQSREHDTHEYDPAPVDRAEQAPVVRDAGRTQA